MVKKNLEIDPGRGQKDLKGLTPYICKNICEHFINVCVSERKYVCVRESEFVCVCV